MQLRNTSRYPTDRVRALVELGMAGVETSDVAVHVKNTRRKAYGGRAYRGVPRLSPVSAAYLVTLHLGEPGRFPATNLVEVARWLPWGTTTDGAEAAAAARGGRAIQQVVRDGRARRLRVGVALRRPYGGRGSPLLELRDWREALVTVAAHEAWHVHQFRHGLRCAEAECERFARAALDRLREEGPRSR